MYDSDYDAMARSGPQPATTLGVVWRLVWIYPADRWANLFLGVSIVVCNIGVAKHFELLAQGVTLAYTPLTFAGLAPLLLLMPGKLHATATRALVALPLSGRRIRDGAWLTEVLSMPAFLVIVTALLLAVIPLSTAFRSAMLLGATCALTIFAAIMAAAFLKSPRPTKGDALLGRIARSIDALVESCLFLLPITLVVGYNQPGLLTGCALVSILVLVWSWLRTPNLHTIRSVRASEKTNGFRFATGFWSEVLRILATRAAWLLVGLVAYISTMAYFAQRERVNVFLVCWWGCGASEGLSVYLRAIRALPLATNRLALFLVTHGALVGSILAIAVWTKYVGLNPTLLGVSAVIIAWTLATICSVVGVWNPIDGQTKLVSAIVASGVASLFLYVISTLIAPSAFLTLVVVVAAVSLALTVDGLSNKYFFDSRAYRRKAKDDNEDTEMPVDRSEFWGLVFTYGFGLIALYAGVWLYSN